MFLYLYAYAKYASNKLNLLLSNHIIGTLHIPDLILKLYIFQHFLYEFILYHRQNGNHSCKSNEKDKELEHKIIT
jgi:hypothetical protein